MPTVVMEPLLCYPDPLPHEVELVLGRSGYRMTCVSEPAAVDALEHSPSGNGWSGAVVSTQQDMAGAIALCRHVRRREIPLAPLLLVVSPRQITELQLREDLFDDFCVEPIVPDELLARLEHLFRRAGRGLRPDLIEYGSLVLNLETYQAAVAGRVLDLTYMEYELLRFLASHPGRVFTRETLLSRVWGYEYYGGARTVDVHIRRLRAKIGEEHAHIIQTVRSVGYRFGQVGWTPSAGSPGGRSMAEA